MSTVFLTTNQRSARALWVISITPLARSRRSMLVTMFSTWWWAKQTLLLPIPSNGKLIESWSMNYGRHGTNFRNDYAKLTRFSMCRLFSRWRKRRSDGWTSWKRPARHCVSEYNDSLRGSTMRVVHLVTHMGTTETQTSARPMSQNKSHRYFTVEASRRHL